MTDPTYRHLIVVADRSGSMDLRRVETQQGINTLFAEQAAEATASGGRGTASLYQFDTEHDTVFEHAPLAAAPAYHLVPRGNTALLDAIGFAFTREGAWLASLPEQERPGHVIAVIGTDGQENSSREYTLEQVREVLRVQQEVYAWRVLFIGANMDAVAVAGMYGIPASRAMTFNTTSTDATYSSVSATTSRIVAGAGEGFTDAERASAVGR